MCLVEHSEGCADRETVEKGRVGLVRGRGLIEAQYHDAVSEPVQIGRGISPHTDYVDLAVPKALPCALELPCCLLQQLAAPGKPHHDGRFVLAKVITDEVHAGPGLANAGRKVQYCLALAGVEEAAHFAGRETLVLKHSVCRRGGTAERDRDLRSAVDDQSEESEECSPLLRRPLDGTEVATRRDVLPTPQSDCKFLLLLVRKQLKEVLSLRGVCDQAFWRHSCCCDRSQRLLGPGSVMQQVQQLACMLTQEPAHVGQRGRAEDGLKGDTWGSDHRWPRSAATT